MAKIPNPIHLAAWQPSASTHRQRCRSCMETMPFTPYGGQIGDDTCAIRQIQNCHIYSKRDSR